LWKVNAVLKKALSRMGLPLFVTLTVGGMLYILSITVEVAPLYGEVTSGTGYLP